VLVSAAALLFASSAQAAERPAGIPPLARSHKLAKPPVPARAKRPAKARAAGFSNVFSFGRTNCPMIRNSSDVANYASISPPVVRGTSNTDWFVYWTTVGYRTASGTSFGPWDGPYWLYMGDQTKVFNPYTQTWGWINDGHGSTGVTWPFGSAGLGYQRVVDYATGAVKEGWTGGFHAGPTGWCSNF
jgi:hypothetical protein